MATQVGLAAAGTLKYNGFKFEGAIHVEAETTYVYDDHRSVIAHEIVVTVRFIVVDTGNPFTDQRMELIRQKLGEGGKEFIFINKGFGTDLIVNSPGGGGVRDIADGPSPELLSWRPVGNDRAAECLWRIKVITAPCGKNSRNFGISSLDWGMTFDIDERGLTTRTISGNLTVVGNQGQVTADAFRDQLLAPFIPGFARSRNYSVSPDRRRLDFTITDRQIPSNNPYPQLVPAITANHRSSWEVRNAATYRHTISATIEPHLGVHPSQAWAIFQQIVNRRVLQAANGNLARIALLTSFDVDESLFGLGHSFSVTYTILRCVQEILLDAGLFTPLNTNTWTEWGNSMSDAWNSRGLSQLRDVAANDIEVTLCTSPVSTVVNNLHRIRGIGPPARTFSFENQYPNEETSWIKYEMDIIPIRECPVSRQSIIQSPGSDSGSWEVDRGTPPSIPADYGPNSATVKFDKIQSAGVPRYGARLLLDAQRAGHKIPRPAIKSIGGRIAHEVRSAMQQTVIANALGVPVYAAVAFADYWFDGSPGKVEPKRNQKEDC